MRIIVFLVCLSFLLFTSFLLPTNPVNAATMQPAADVMIVLSGTVVRHSAPVILDIDGNGTKEIILADGNARLYVINGVSNQVIWEKNLIDYLPGYASTGVNAGLAVGDLDNDGKIELVIATGGLPISASRPGAMLVLTYVGGATPFTLMAGWPRFAFDELGRIGATNRPDGVPDGFFSTPAIGDIDGDGDKEIVIGGMDRRLHAWHHTGAYVTGWPIDANRKHYRDTLSSPALADLDQDGKQEIIIGTNNYKLPACPNPYYFYVLRGDASFFPGWPVETTQNISSSPAVGDLDGDGFLEIVAGTGSYNESCGQAPDGKKVYAWDRFGQPLPGWPRPTAGNMETSPALGDLDGDGKLEVVMACYDLFNGACSSLYVWRSDGTPLPGFPVQSPQAPAPWYVTPHLGPVLADLDGNGSIEILQGDGSGISVVKSNGAFDATRKRESNLWSAPGLTVDDIDGDGLLETLLLGKDPASDHGAVYIWQETGASASKVPWPTFRRDNSRSGFHPLGYTLAGIIKDEDGVPQNGVTLTLTGNQNTTSDSQGRYLFKNLASGQYTVTPSSANTIFEPATQMLTLPPSTDEINFVLRNNRIRGQVLHSNGVPFAGASLGLSGGTQTNSATDGLYQFLNLTPQTYQITPKHGNNRFLPEIRTVTVPDSKRQDFVILAPPATQTISPGTTARLGYSDTQGLSTTVQIETNMGSGTISITPTLASPPARQSFTGHAFEFVSTVPMLLTGGQQAIPLTTPAPFTIIELTIHYSDADLRFVSDESQLMLYKQVNDAWQPLTQACPQATPVVRPANNTFTVNLCSSGLFALFGPTQQAFLPVVRK